MTRLRMTPEERHANHHRLIAERYEAWAQQPHRSATDKERRKQLEKRAWHTMKSHLVSEHGVGRGGHPFALGKTWDFLIDLHDRKHAE